MPLGKLLQPLPTIFHDFKEATVLHPQQVFTTFLQEEPTLKPPSLNLANTSLHIVMLHSLIHTLSGPSALFNQNFDSCFDRVIQVIGTRLLRSIYLVTPLQCSGRVRKFGILEPRQARPISRQNTLSNLVGSITNFLSGREYKRKIMSKMNHVGQKFKSWLGYSQNFTLNCTLK